MPARQAPKRIRPRSLGDYLEVMTKAVFQSGMSWQVVESKWPGFQKAFKGFDPAKVSRLTPKGIDKILKDPAVIRNQRKILATVDNAETLLELDREHGGFKKYLRSHGDYWDLADDLKRQFSFLGDFGVYYFLYVVGEKVPPYEEFHAVQGGKRPRHRAKPSKPASRAKPKPARRAATRGKSAAA
jgi:Methyladenine glycosylase